MDKEYYILISCIELNGVDIKSLEELPLVLQLQYFAQKTDGDIEELLRRAKLVAMKLSLSDFEMWCDSELMGYQCGIEELPSYRVTIGRLRAFNPVHGLIPFDIEDGEVRATITTVSLAASVGEYVNLISKSDVSLSVNLSQEVLSYLHKVQQRDFGIALEPRLQIDVTQIMLIVTHVRNTIFNWSLELEKSGILGEGMQFTREEREKAMSSTTYNIENMQGVAGHVQDSSVTQTNQMINNQMDLKTLLSVLKSQGIQDNDLDNLRVAISEDQKPSVKDVFGENVSKWYSKMITKAADGSWQIGIGTAANMLAQSLNSFYGLV